MVLTSLGRMAVTMSYQHCVPQNRLAAGMGDQVIPPSVDLLMLPFAVPPHVAGSSKVAKKVVLRGNPERFTASFPMVKSAFASVRVQVAVPAQGLPLVETQMPFWPSLRLSKMFRTIRFAFPGSMTMSVTDRFAAVEGCTVRRVKSGAADGS